jgi:hypothetical protein
LFTPGGKELFLGANPDFFDGLQTVGNECRTEDHLWLARTPSASSGVTVALAAR